MKRLFFLLLLFGTHTVFSQSIIIGDTANKHVEQINQTFSNTSVSFDINCDSLPDLTFTSETSYGQGSWPRLSFYMQANVQVLNSGTGFVTPFTQNQVIQVNNPNIWTSHLDFIWGAGKGGIYGQNLDKKYIVFRKLTSSDTTYLFMEITNGNAVLTIHKVISNCAASLLSPFGVTNDFKNVSINIYPNPFTNKLYFDKDELKGINFSIYNFQGKLIQEFKGIGKGEIDLSNLISGPYLFKYQVNDKQKTEIFIKE